MHKNISEENCEQSVDKRGLNKPLERFRRGFKIPRPALLPRVVDERHGVVICCR